MLPSVLNELGLKLAVKPVGRPPVVNTTDPLKPGKVESEIVKFVLPPTGTVPEPDVMKNAKLLLAPPLRGITAGAMVKLLATVNEPRRVPGAVGEKVTVIVHVLPTGKGEEETQSSVSE